MTDGIIQDILNNEYTEYTMNEDMPVIELIHNIQTKLIEKIKEEFIGKTEDSYVIHRYLVINKLIGDNKE